MKLHSEYISTFINETAKSKIGVIGAALAIALLPILLAMLLLDIFEVVTNPYFGAVIYMVLAPLFFLGLIMMFIGRMLTRNTISDDDLDSYPTVEEITGRICKNMVLGIALTGAGIIVLTLTSYSGYHYMESNAFCGTLCHSVMAPEYAAHKLSAHSQVKCVQCHVGSGASSFVKAKINGTRQLAAIITGDYEMPIDAPAHAIHKASETCNECHRPETDYGNKLVINRSFRTDEHNTPVQTVLLVKVGSAEGSGNTPSGSHWHAASENRITYRTEDPGHLVIPEVTLHRSDGTDVVYRIEESEEILPASVPEHEMNCMNCHNRPAHAYLSAIEAIDRGMVNGDIPTELPFIKQQALKAVTFEAQDHTSGYQTINAGLTEYYSSKHPELTESDESEALIKQAITGVQAAWVNNVWPTQKIQWDTYSSNMGHSDNKGCYRCHDGRHVSENGQRISLNCRLCHIILAKDDEDPEILKTLKLADPDWFTDEEFISEFSTEIEPETEPEIESSSDPQ